MTDITEELDKLKNPKQADVLSRFFKTGKGEYGERDIFLGIKVPVQRKIAKKYDLSLEKLEKLINSEIHEHRLTALFILIDKYRELKNSLSLIESKEGTNSIRYKKADKELKKIYDFYLKNTKKINNWDLVDLSAPNIIGDYLLDKNRKILYQLAKSKNLWEKRIAILSSFRFIKENQFDDALKIAERLLKDSHDLIHKAVGWMLREIGKRNLEVEENFLRKYYKVMPRTMLRYAIEKFDEEKRRFYLGK